MNFSEAQPLPIIFTNECKVSVSTDRKGGRHGLMQPSNIYGDFLHVSALTVLNHFEFKELILVFGSVIMKYTVSHAESLC